MYSLEFKQFKNYKKIRYLLLENKFYKLRKKYWNRGHYFRNSFVYNNKIPFSIIYNFTYRGLLINNPTKRTFRIFGKKINFDLYKYILFREKNGKLQIAYSLPLRKKINDGDSIFIRNNISTYGPFTFYKNIN